MVFSPGIRRYGDTAIRRYGDTAIRSLRISRMLHFHCFCLLFRNAGRNGRASGEASSLASPVLVRIFVTRPDVGAVEAARLGMTPSVRVRRVAAAAADAGPRPRGGPAGAHRRRRRAGTPRVSCGPRGRMGPLAPGRVSRTSGPLACARLGDGGGGWGMQRDPVVARPAQVALDEDPPGRHVRTN